MVSCVVSFCLGCRVIMACRDTAKAEIARDDIHESLKNVPDVGSLVVKKLDLASIKSIRAFAEEILKEEKKIHLLVNNAGNVLPFLISRLLLVLLVSLTFSLFERSLWFCLFLILLKYSSYFLGL